jgi:hypothetical protein
LGEVASLDPRVCSEVEARFANNDKRAGRRAARSARAVPELGRHRLDLPILAFAAASAFFTSALFTSSPPSSACPLRGRKILPSPNNLFRDQPNF